MTITEPVLKQEDAVIEKDVEFETLQGFYLWCKQVGHYQCHEAVDRYRKILAARSGS